MQLQKEQQREQTKNQLKIARKNFGSRKAIFWRPKYVLLHLRQTLILYYVAAYYENKQQLDKTEKTQNYLILVFFRKKFISKDMKAINYKIKKLNRFVHSSKGSPLDLHLSRICLTFRKRTSNMTKIKISFTFFAKNPCGSQ